MKIERHLFRWASKLTTLRILLSGNPMRIGKHLVRKETYKRAAKLGRKI